MVKAAKETTHASKSRNFVFRLQPGDDLRRKISDFAGAHKIKAGAIVTCVGSLKKLNLRFANQASGTLHTGYFEIVSLTGTVSQESMHLHLSVSNSDGVMLGGHLLDGCRVYTTAEIVITELMDLKFIRELDPASGYKELVIMPRRKGKPARK